ncbi:MAG: type I DNA topoisomerase [candidate division Zixibacteria bacterium]|nr:type I DNA topoisomerase [candidate division Zixibacteria bacterium]
MPHQLVIVESPTKTKTLQKFLGNGFDIMATRGHIRDLPTKSLGVDIENNFEPEYVPIDSKDNVVKELKKAAKQADVIYLAPDPDREGEAIAWHVAHILNRTKAEVRRASFNEITKSAVLEALENAGKIDMRKVDAQQARRVLDRIVGYKVSPFLWKTVCRGLSAGRVQSVALRLICEREESIRAFTPQEYWTVEVTLHKEGKKKTPKFTAMVSEVDGDKIEIQNEEAAHTIEADLNNADIAVGAVKVQNKRRNPPQPYITSTLQQDAARRLYFSPKKTMTVAQHLYEGVEIGKQGSVGLITYMRTDSTRVANEAVVHAREVIAAEYGKEYHPDKMPTHKSKGRTQDAHEAIRPTYFDLSPDKIKKYLSRDQLKLYTLIWNRFLASQMSPAVIERTSVDIRAEAETKKGKSKTTREYTLKTGAEKITFPGFLKIYEDTPEENGDGKKENPLPALEKGDVLGLDDIDSQQHFTKPPPRFSEASLVKELEANGIGRPSTYAQIISTILSRNYVRLEERRLMPTELGEVVNSILVEAFPELFNVEFTAEMENELDRVEEGIDPWTDVMKSFYGSFAESLGEASSRTKEIKESYREVLDDKCPECSSDLIIKWSRSGKFIACTGYPDCRYTSDVGGDNGAQTNQETDQVCEKCGSPMVIKSGRFGQFMACSAYPKCKNTKPIPTGVKCPEERCTGELVPRRTRTGRTFYSCSRYPECKYAVWNRPVPTPCPHCDSEFMLQKSTKAKGDHLKCPACGNIAEIEAETEASSS